MWMKVALPSRTGSLRVPEADTRRESLRDFLDDVYTSRAEFLVFDDGYRAWSYSYEQVKGAAYAFASRLRRERIAKGDKIFPEGRISHQGDVLPFQPGVGMLASRLNVPVIPVRLKGLDHVLHPTWHMARPGRATVTFGAPLTLQGQDYLKLAKQVEEAVKAL